ncbi:HMCT-like protein [Mya arenaria]|uniref:HMCT-like protein n=2 Tax=Mya arenaria TaxID=6604 RepID=A0ABY7EK36_MYAAR|nr:HMCT-like protein [Mya arenaria]
MEPVSDDQITASSVHSEAHDTRGSRLDSVPTNSHVGAWAAGTTDANQYIQVQFNCPYHVIGVAMQGRPIVGVDCCNQHVTAYKLLYSGDCVNFLTIRDSSGSDVILDGNTDQDTVVTSMLPSPVTALCVRINPVTWIGDHISMRFDILGCSMNEQQH